MGYIVFLCKNVSQMFIYSSCEATAGWVRQIKVVIFPNPGLFWSWIDFFMSPRGATVKGWQHKEWALWCGFCPQSFPLELHWECILAVDLLRSTSKGHYMFWLFCFSYWLEVGGRGGRNGMRCMPMRCCCVKPSCFGVQGSFASAAVGQIGQGHTSLSNRTAEALIVKEKKKSFLEIQRLYLWLDSFQFSLCHDKDISSWVRLRGDLLHDIVKLRFPVLSEQNKTKQARERLHPG